MLDILPIILSNLFFVDVYALNTTNYAPIGVIYIYTPRGIIY